MLAVADLGASLAFYRDRLGFEVKMEIPGFAFLDGGGITLALGEPLAKVAGGSAGGVELVFGVTSVTATHAALAQAGLAFRNPPRNVDGTNWAANFGDPDGHLLSIYGPE
jgi:uncharacterized protein